MFTIGIILMLLGIIGIIAAPVMWVLGLKNAKVALRNGLITLVLGNIFAALGVQRTESLQPTQSSQTTQPTQSVQTPVPKKTPPESVAPQNKPLPPVLPGLQWVDITLNLEREPYRFRFTAEPNRLTPTIERRAKRIDPDTGAEMLVRIVTYNENVVMYEATVSGPGAHPTAGWFIPYLATAPFEGNPQVESKVWAEKALKKVRVGQPVTRKIGEVVMELFGNPPFYYGLEVFHKDYSAYLIKVSQ